MNTLPFYVKRNFTEKEIADVRIVPQGIPRCIAVDGVCIYVGLDEGDILIFNKSVCISVFAKIEHFIELCTS